jgi:uncharacterized repeat protein (TIGR01451 family)
MKTQKIYRRPLWAALAVVASLFLAMLITVPQVEANTGAGATILNNVTINYQDASSVTNYSANAATLVTVNLVRAGLTYSGRPTTASKGTSASMPAGQTINSGATQTYLIALTANANGGDTYTLTDAISGVTNMASDSVSWATVKPDGSTVITSGSPSSIALGASVIQAESGVTISIPGGSTVAAAITTGAIKTLVVGGIDYSVSSITSGTAPNNTNNGGTYYNSTGTATGEALAVITLAANTSGANVTPNFSGNALVGTLAAEQQLVLVSVIGVVGATAGTNGTVAFTLTTKDGAGGNSASMSSAIITTFNASNLQVEKLVRNCTSTGTSCGTFAATATGKPGDVLEYEVLVKNAGSSQATKVAALDAVPTYTQLICGAAYGGNTVCTALGTQIFATIYDGTNTANIPCTAGGLANTGYGSAAGYVAASALNFYLGTSSTTSAGGNVAAAATYTITYRVVMN